MKTRPSGFLRNELIDHNSEQFDYIAELHGYLWRFVRAAIPGASGVLDNHIDRAIEIVEKTSSAKQQPEELGITL